MKTRTLTIAVMCAAATLVVNSASARDDRTHFKISEAMSAPDATAKLSQNIKFFFADAPHPAVEHSFGVFTSNKKSNGFGKEDKVACDWAFLSALITFQDRALKEGGDAVINIKSYYKSVPFSSATEYECGAGNVMVGVALQGEVVKLKK